MNDTPNGGQSSFGRSAGQSGPIIPKSPTQALRPEKVPPPPKRSRRAKSQLVIFMNFVMTTIVLVIVAAVGVVFFGKSEFEKTGPLTANTNVMIAEGSGVTQIADLLERRGIISDRRVFRFATAAYMPDDTLKAGEYEIKAGASMRDVMDLLRSGKSILYSVTLAEGLSVEQMFARVAQNEVLTGDMPTELPAEGTLRPETYKFSRGTTRSEIVAQMLEAQTRLVDQIWERRDQTIPIANKNEFVTLASIVEKETGRADERTRVAAVFINRLNQGIRLQSDPTIIYGLFGGAGKPSDRPIYRSDIDKPTPYNTYVIDGLPPTPISNPGRASLEAVANPSKTNDLFFVADGTGGHAFAETLKEHNANVRRWRRIEAERKAKAEAESGN